MNTLSKVREACYLRSWMPDEKEFLESMLDVFGARPLNGHEENLIHFLGTIYNAGRVAGIRQERDKRKRRLSDVNCQSERDGLRPVRT